MPKTDLDKVSVGKAEYLLKSSDIHLLNIFLAASYQDNEDGNNCLSGDRQYMLDLQHHYVQKRQSLPAKSTSYLRLYLPFHKFYSQPKIQT